jgi:peptide/nickel transport system substrate-binding protein
MLFNKAKALGAAAVISVSVGVALPAAAGAKAVAKTASATSSVSVFTGQVGDFVQNFDPFNPTGSYLQPTLGVIYEGLFYYNKAAAEAPVPVLGTSFKWNTKGTVLTVQVRTGVKWSNGMPLTPADVAYSLDLVDGNKALNTTGTTWHATVGKGSSVVIKFPATAFTLEAQLLGNEPIVPESIWKKIENPTSIINANPVGSGPYELKQFTPETILLAKNPNYWGTGANAPAVDEVRYIELANADAATTALETGTVDYMGSFLPTLKQIAASDKNVVYSNTPQATTSLFTCSNAALGCTGPQTDVAVRQAIYYAMDRTQMDTQALDGFGKPASPTLLPNFVNEGQIENAAWKEVPQTANDAKANSILQADGWTKNSSGYYEKNGTELDLTVNVVSGWTDYDTDCTLLQGQLQAAGIKLTVNEVAQQAWTQAEVSGNFELSLNSINMGASSNPYYTYDDYLDSAATAKVGSSATTNVSRFSDPAVDGAISSLAKTDSTAVEAKDYNTIQTAIVSDLPYIPIYVNQALTEYNKKSATGWPGPGNLYAFPEPWGGNYGLGIVLKRIRPVK